MKKAIAAVAGLVVAALSIMSLAFAGSAVAQSDGPGPDSILCRTATAAFNLQLDAVLDLGKDKFKQGSSAPSTWRC